MDTQDEADLCFPQLLNTSCKKPTTPLSQILLFHIMMPSMSLLTMTLNLLVITAVSHFRQLHTTTNILLLSLAVTDFLVGLLLMPGEILQNTACWFLGQLTCSLYNYISFIVTSASVGNMVLISVDRYVAICDPLHYPTRITDRKVKLCVCLCWFFCVFYNILFTKDDLLLRGRHNSCYGECIFAVDYFAGTTDIVLTFIALVTVIVVLYMRVFVVAVSQACAMRSHVTAVTLQLSVTLTTKKSELKAARTLGVLVFLICFCPYYTISLLGNELLDSSSTCIVGLLFFVNSCLNPLIYAMFYPWFRKAVKLIVTLQIMQAGSCESNILYKKEILSKRCS